MIEAMSFYIPSHCCLQLANARNRALLPKCPNRSKGYVFIMWAKFNVGYFFTEQITIKCMKMKCAAYLP